VGARQLEYLALPAPAIRAGLTQSGAEHNGTPDTVDGGATAIDRMKRAGETVVAQCEQSFPADTDTEPAIDDAVAVAGPPMGAQVSGDTQHPGVARQHFTDQFRRGRRPPSRGRPGVDQSRAGTDARLRRWSWLPNQVDGAVRVVQQLEAGRAEQSAGDHALSVAADDDQLGRAGGSDQRAGGALVGQ
jgi:hypothetical protein